MASEFLLPDPGEGIHEAEILEVHVSVDDTVEDGDVLFTVETDKAAVDIPASFDGRIAQIPVSAGDIVEVGEVLLTYEPEGAEDAVEGGPDGDESETGGGGEDEPEAAAAGEATGEPEEAETDEDEAAAGETTDEPEEAETDEDKASGGEAGVVAEARPVPASPATRSLAKKIGIDLHEIEGSGPDGRVEPEDVKAAAGEAETEAEGPAEAAAQTAPDQEETAAADEGAPEEEPSGEEAPAGPDYERWGPVEWVDLRGVRRATAKHMTESWEQIPHVSHHDVADITELEAFRREHAEEVESESGKLTITAFLVKAVVAALSEHPRFNASLDIERNRIALKSYYHIGIAVDTPDGLVVPALRDADSKSLVDIAVELTDIAARMREGERSLEDLAGTTFTITNPGGIGGTSFTPIINHPEVAILGAARANWEPVVLGLDDADADPADAELETRLRLPLVLGFDHRVNDGADAARFMNTVVGLLEDVSRFTLRT